MNILFRVRIHVLVKWTCRLRQLLNLEWLSCFEHAQSHIFEDTSFWYPFLQPHQTTRHSNMGVQSRHVNKLSMATFNISC